MAVSVGAETTLAVVGGAGIRVCSENVEELKIYRFVKKTDEEGKEAEGEGKAELDTPPEGVKGMVGVTKVVVVPLVRALAVPPPLQRHCGGGGEGSTTSASRA